MNLSLMTLHNYLKMVFGYLFPVSAQEASPGDTVRGAFSSAADSLSDAASSGVAHVQTVSAPPPGWNEEIFLHEFLSALIPIAFAVITGILIWKRLETRKAVELAMIEKGLDPRGAAAELDSTRKFRALRLALLLVGTSLGLCVAMILWTTFPDAFSYDYRPLVALTSVTFFAGLSLTVYHIIATSLEKH